MILYLKRIGSKGKYDSNDLPSYVSFDTVNNILRKKNKVVNQHSANCFNHQKPEY